MNTTTTLDHLHCRRALHCSLCSKPKHSGLVVCWLCWWAHRMKHGNAEVENWLDRAEAELESSLHI